MEDLINELREIATDKMPKTSGKPSPSHCFTAYLALGPFGDNKLDCLHVRHFPVSECGSRASSLPRAAILTQCLLWGQLTLPVPGHSPR